MVWEERYQKAFEELRDACVTTPVLCFADFTKPFELHTDASGHGLGAVLYQRQDDGKLGVVAFASRGLSKAERNYPAHKLEFLAMKWAIVESIACGASTEKIQVAGLSLE